MADRTISQTQTEWAVHGMIARLKMQLERETDAGKRQSLEDAIAEQRKRIVLD